MSALVFKLTGLSLRLGQADDAVTALSRVTLSIAPGERVALVGANGSGKSSLLRLLAGLFTPTEGTLQRAAQASMAMLFQRPFLMRMSAQRNVALGLWLRGMPWGEAKVSALAALTRVGLGAQAMRSARQLSGGQQQRVALAQAWALLPDVLLLDEPTASLDPHAKREVEALLDEFAHSSGLMRPDAAAAVTMIFASHNLGQVKRLATRVIYLERGQVLADLPVTDFFDGDVLQTRYPGAHLFVKGELV